MMKPYPYAEKSSNGHEESWCEGSNHDDIGFGGSVYFPLYFSILHLIIELGPFSRQFLLEEGSQI